MDAIKGNIFEILNGNKQFVIPVYQRFYSWEEEQCHRLWTDIVDMQRSGKSGHFVGSIVNIAEQTMPTGVQKYMIIDGQQRMTTLTLLMLALRDDALANPEDGSINAHRIDGMLLKNEFETGDERYKLLLTENDRDVLIDLVERKPIDENVKSKVLEDYKFFVEKVKENEITKAEIYQSIGKLQIVNITLDRAVDDAQAIFESLNSTGKALSESDLIRNFVLMGLEPIEQNYVYEHYWRPMEKLFDYETQTTTMDAFFRHYLIMKTTSIPKMDQVYEAFRTYYLHSEFDSIREFCDDIVEYAHYYTSIIFNKTNDPKLRKLYADISELKMEVSYPFLLKIHHDQSEGILSMEEMQQILEYCISYIFRRSICNIPTNSLNKTFATLKNSIRPDDYMNSVKAFFILRETYKIFPDDDQFGDAFVTRDLYNMRIKNYILSKLENNGNKAPIRIENYTIEHIMPQNKNLSKEWKKELGEDWESVQKKYLHTIGNLTLTAYNSEMGDRSFMEKMNMEGGFKQSALRLNQDVVLLSTWNERTIRTRARNLLEKAKTIWPYPFLSEEELAPYVEGERKPQKYSLASYDMNEWTKPLFERLNNRLMNLSPLVVCEFKKMYIAYKLDTNFVDVVVQKKRLRLSVNMKFSDIKDPKGICKDVTGIGRWGNGDAELFMNDVSEIDDIMDIIVQSYNAQVEEME